MKEILKEKELRQMASMTAEQYFKNEQILLMLKALKLNKKDVAKMLQCTAPNALKQFVKPAVVKKMITDTLKPYNF